MLVSTCLVTLPFSPEQMLGILAAASNKIAACTRQAQMRWRRARALVLLLRYTGLRIPDAVGCSTDRLQDGRLFLYTAKTGQHVYLPLPDFVIKELDAVPGLAMAIGSGLAAERLRPRGRNGPRRWPIYSPMRE
jgi:hypothetical protein